MNHVHFHHEHIFFFSYSIIKLSSITNISSYLICWSLWHTFAFSSEWLLFSSLIFRILRFFFSIYTSVCVYSKGVQKSSWKMCIWNNFCMDFNKILPKISFPFNSVSWTTILWGYHVCMYTHTKKHTLLCTDTHTHTTGVFKTVTENVHYLFIPFFHVFICILDRR